MRLTTIEHFVFRLLCLLPVVALQGLLARELGAQAVVRVRSRVAVGLVLAVLLRETESCFIFFPGMEIYRSAAKGLTRVVYVQFYSVFPGSAYFWDTPFLWTGLTNHETL